MASHGAKEAARHIAEMRRSAFVAGIAQSALEAARVHAIELTTESGRLAEEAAHRLFGAIYGATVVPPEYVDEDLVRLRNNVARNVADATPTEAESELQSVANHTTNTTREVQNGS